MTLLQDWGLAIAASIIAVSGASLLWGIQSEFVEGSLPLTIVAWGMCIVGVGYFVLLALIVPILIVGVTVSVRNNIAAFHDSFSNDQHLCVYQCQHVILGDDCTSLVCEIKEKIVSELTADEIRSCDAFLPREDEE